MAGNRLRIRRLLRPVIERIPPLYAAYHAWRDQRLAHRPPAMSALGFRFSGYPAMENGSFEPEETAIVDRLLDETQILINVGANVGYYCCLALKRGTHTLAFEPIDTSLRLLYQNVAANGWQDNIEVYPLALGERAGLVPIYGGGTSASLLPQWTRVPQGRERLVPISTLDLLVGERLAGQQCLVVMDVEGAEIGVLRGAKQLLAMQPRPVWMVEIVVPETNVKPVVDYLAVFDIFYRNGYGAWTATQPMRWVLRAELEEIARGGRNRLGTHNFVFRHAG
jgi:FkbM family methyltransferase